MGKGSKRRPQQEPEEKVRENWDRIFGKAKKKEDKRFDKVP